MARPPGHPHSCRKTPKTPGRVQAAQTGSVRVPARIGLTMPQPEQRARRCRQAWQQGFPVSLEITAGAERPQIEQIIVVIGRQDPHSGPSAVRTLTGRQ